MEFAELIEQMKTEKPEWAEVIIGHNRSKDSEAAKLRIDSKSYKEKAARFESLKEHGLDLDADIGEQIAGLKRGKDETKSEFEKRFAVMEQKVLTAEKSAQEATAKGRRKSLEAALATEVEKNFFGSKAYLRTWMDDGIFDLDESERPIVKIGDKVYDNVADGINELRKIHASDAKTLQTGGSGSNNSGGGTSAKVMDHSAFMKLTDKARSDFMASGGTIK